jgi:hypothetical protein
LARGLQFHHLFLDSQVGIVEDLLFKKDRNATMYEIDKKSDATQRRKDFP